MSDSISSKIKNKISEDLSPTRNITGFHLKIVSTIAIIWSLFQLWYASPFPFMLNIGITGQNGFIGNHLSNAIKLLPNEFKLIDFQLDFFENQSSCLYFESTHIKRYTGEVTFN